MAVDIEKLQEEMDSIRKQGTWGDIRGTIMLLQQPATHFLGVQELTDQQIELIEGQRQINGRLLSAVELILEALDLVQAEVTSAALGGKIQAAKDVLKGLLGEVPPGCNRGG